MSVVSSVFIVHDNTTMEPNIIKVGAGGVMIIFEVR